MQSESEFIDSILPMPKIKALKPLGIVDLFYYQDRCAKEFGISDNSFNLFCSIFYKNVSRLTPDAAAYLPEFELENLDATLDDFLDNELLAKIADFDSRFNIDNFKKYIKNFKIDSNIEILTAYIYDFFIDEKLGNDYLTHLLSNEFGISYYKLEPLIFEIKRDINTLRLNIATLKLNKESVDEKMLKAIKKEIRLLRNKLKLKKTKLKEMESIYNLYKTSGNLEKIRIIEEFERCGKMPDGFLKKEVDCIKHNLKLKKMVFDVLKNFYDNIKKSAFEYLQNNFEYCDERCSFERSTLKHFTNEEMDEKYRIICNADGRFVYASKPDEPLNVAIDKNSNVIFILRSSGDLYILPNSLGVVHHSSHNFDDVVAVGELGFSDGIITSVSNKSGHYKPKLNVIKKLADALTRIIPENKLYLHANAKVATYYFDKKSNTNEYTKEFFRNKLLGVERMGYDFLNRQ